MAFEANRDAAHADAHPSSAAIAGHPIHPMLVPLPIGLLTAAAVSDLAALRTRDPFFARASRLLIAGGIATGLTAAPFGLADFLAIGAARRRPEAWLHGLGNVAVIVASAANLGLRARAPRTVPALGVALSAAAASMLMLTGWLGGELSYRHRIGVAPPHSSDGDGSSASGRVDAGDGAIGSSPGDAGRAMIGEPVAVMEPGAGGRLDPALVAD